MNELRKLGPSIVNADKPLKATQRGDADDDFDTEALPDKIGKNLRQIYDDVLNEPIPDDFLSLLAQADEAQK